MCVCITKQETAHKGQARYRRQLLTGGGKRKLEKRNTRMSSDYAGFMSHPIHSSVRFFYIHISLPSSSKEQIFFSRTRKDFADAKEKYYKAYNAPQKDFHPLFICSWSEKSSERMKAQQLQRAQLLCWATHWYPAPLSFFPGTNRGLTAESKDDKSVELFLLLSVCNLSLHATYIHLSCVTGYTPSLFKICFKCNTSKLM